MIIFISYNKKFISIFIIGYKYTFKFKLLLYIVEKFKVGVMIEEIFIKKILFSVLLTSFYASSRGLEFLLLIILLIL